MKGERRKIEKIKEEIQLLNRELHERESSLPKHSIRPLQMQAIFELEEQIKNLEKRLQDLQREEED